MWTLGYVRLKMIIFEGKIRFYVYTELQGDNELL